MTIMEHNDTHTRKSVLLLTTGRGEMPVCFAKSRSKMYNEQKIGVKKWLVYYQIFYFFYLVVYLV